MPRRNLVLILVSLVVSFACYDRAAHNHYARTVATAMDIIETYYYEPVEKRPLFENAMQGMVSRLDPYSAYVNPPSLERLNRGIEQNFVGIGILVAGPPQRPEITVISPVLGSPAHKAGIHAGDVIVEVEGQSTESLTLDQAIGLIKGPRGTPVRIKVRRPPNDEILEFTIVRDRVKTRSVLGDTRRPDGTWNYFLREHPDIGYVRIVSFGELTPEELREVLAFSDHPVRGLIIDLRGNPGGLLQTAVSVADMFLDGGVIVTTRGRNGRRGDEFFATPGTVVPRDLPLVVLVDKLSASASEIVAACLQDHRRAVIVGERTWGKGTVQRIFRLEGRRSGLKLTTATYHRPSGANIHRRQGATEEDEWGVRPDPGYEVKLDDETYRELYRARQQRDVLEGEIPAEAFEVEDRQLERAIEAIRELWGEKKKEPQDNQKKAVRA